MARHPWAAVAIFLGAALAFVCTGHVSQAAWSLAGAGIACVMT